MYRLVHSFQCDNVTLFELLWTQVQHRLDPFKDEAIRSIERNIIQDHDYNIFTLTTYIASTPSFPLSISIPNRPRIMNVIKVSSPSNNTAPQSPPPSLTLPSTLSRPPPCLSSSSPPSPPHYYPHWPYGNSLKTTAAHA